MERDLGDLLAFLIVTQQLFTIFGEMTHTDNRVKPIHFGSNLADIHIWIRINPDLNPGSDFDLVGVCCYLSALLH